MVLLFAAHFLDGMSANTLHPQNTDHKNMRGLIIVNSTGRLLHSLVKVYLYSTFQ